MLKTTDHLDQVQFIDIYLFVTLITTLQSSGDVFVFHQIETNVWMTSGSFNAGPEETSFGNHIAYDNVTHTVMISSLTNVYLYSLDQIKDISNHHNIGPIFVGPLDVIEFDHEVANIVMGHNYAMISLSGKENDHIKFNYVSIYSLGIGEYQINYTYCYC